MVVLSRSDKVHAKQFVIAAVMDVLCLAVYGTPSRRHILNAALRFMMPGAGHS